MKKLLSITLVLLMLTLCSCTTPASGATTALDATALLEEANTIVSARISELYDDYASYYSPNEYELLFADLQGSFGGIGISMAEDPNTGETTIYRVLKNTPASRTEIAMGDVILEVDGASMAEKSSSEIAALIRGPLGTEVKIKLRRGSDGGEYSLSVTRAMITNETVSGILLADYPGTAYIHISSFNDKTDADFATLFNELNSQQQVKQLILDLRSNGGGLFISSIKIGEYFVPATNVVVSEKTSTGNEPYKSASGQLNGIKVVILQNAYTASASEVLIGAIRDTAADATLIGTTTYGKGITQNVARMESGYGHRYTRSIYYTPSGFSLHGIGLDPDIVVEDPAGIEAADYFSYDPTLNPHLKAAIDFLYPEGAPQVKPDAAKDADAAKGTDATKDAADTNKQPAK